MQLSALERVNKLGNLFNCLCVWFLNNLVNNLATSRTALKTDVWQFYVLPNTRHDSCLNLSRYTDTDPTSRERAATVAVEPRISSPGVARSTDWATN